MVSNAIDELFAPLWTTLVGRRASVAVLAVGALCILYTIINTIMTLHADLKLLSQPPVHTVSAPVNPTAQLIAQIPDWHLFGSNAADSDSLPVTSLQLRLVGVVKSSPDQDSRVIISESGAPGKVYRLGDTLSDGVKINSITRDGVILENDGRLEKLPLQRSVLQFEGMPTSLLDSSGE